MRNTAYILLRCVEWLLVNRDKLLRSLLQLLMLNLLLLQMLLNLLGRRSLLLHSTMLLDSAMLLLQALDGCGRCVLVDSVGDGGFEARIRHQGGDKQVAPIHTCTPTIPPSPLCRWWTI
jgi:hypothetical protein